MRRCTTVLFLLSVLVIPALILSVPAHSEVLSDFEANSEGWVLYGISSSKWNSTGGNPGGYLHIVPALGSSGPNGGMAAPAKFLGSWIGMQPSGTLSFDLYFKNQSNNSPGIGQLIRLAGPGGTAHCQLTGSGSQLIDGSWNHYVVPLEEFSWVIKSGTWQSILENVTLLHLKAEFVDGAEIAGFDNIKLSSDPSPAENPYEPDNSRSLASPIPIGQEYQNREIYPNNDVDWIKFDAVHGYGYVIDIVNMYSGNVRCRIYNENNNSVSAEISNLKQWTCPVTGTYYLRIWDDGANQSSAYKVRVLPSYWNGTASWDSNHEPDDARFIAHLNRTDGTVYHYEGNKAADNDWIRFSAEFGNTYTFTLSNETGGNYYFYVYDATASDMSGAKSTNWTWFCPVSGIYYVKIYENGADQAGSYDFSIKSNQTDYSTDILLTHAALYLDSDFGVDKYQLVASSSNCSVPIQWASENSSVVSVDTNGLLQAEDIGTTVVTASCPTVGTSDQTEVTVNADDYEPNNIQAEAKPIDIGRIYQSHILRPNGSEPDKYDWAKFDAVQGAGYVIELAKERGGDLRYHLYDEAGNRLLSSITTRVKWTCPVTGTYYLQMFEYGDDQWASYNVRVLPAYWNGSARWDGNQEPDESRYLANLLKTDGTVYHYANLNKADRDWARFTAKEGVTYTFALTNEAWGNYYFRVHDAHHTNFSGDKSTSWVWTCPATGTYFILLWEGGDNRIGSFDFSIMASELDNTVDIHNAHATLYLDPNFGVENFQLVANSSNCGDLIQWSSDNNSVVSVGSNGLLQAEGVGTAVVTGTCAADGTNDTVIVTVNADDHESNNVQSEARYIAVGQDYQSHIVRPNGSSPDKHDWVKFDAVQGYGYVMELANEQGGNIYFHFYDEAGNRLLTNINTRVNWTCPVTGTYYLQIFDSDNNQWASYNVRVLPAFWNAAAYWGSNQEPDNIHNLARLLKTDGTVYHYVNLANADRDWARFTAREGVSYTIALTNEAGGNYYFRVLDTYYTNFSGDKSTSWTWTCPATGTYFIMLWEGGDDRIGSFNFSITASEQDNTVDIHTTRATLYLDPAYGVDAYQLVAGSSNCNDQIQWSSSDGSVVSVDSNGMLQAVGEGTAVVTATCMADGTSDTSVVTVNADDHEPNNVQAEARYVAVGQDYQSHVVSPNGSNPDKFDWVKFEAVQGYGYVLELANELGGNVHFHFYDEAGNRLLTSIDTRASWTCPVTGAYFLQIFDYDHNQWASYDVRVLPAYWNGTAHWDINHEPDNSYYTANLLKTDGTAYHYANLSNSDRDCARFTAQKGVAYTFTLANEAGGNYYFRILDQEYTNFSGDKNTSWVWTCPATGTYFILLWEAGDDRVGSFDFSISSNRLDNTVDIHSTTATLYLDPVYGVNALQLFANSSNCSDQIQWSSSDGSVVSVDSNGLLQAEGTGTAVVKAVCLADGTNDTSVVTVNADAYEPNNVQAEARYITVGQDFQSHVVSPNGSNPDKHDWVKFDAVQGYGYVMELANELGGNIHFHFYDEAGNRLLTSINTRVNWTCPVTGTYYLQIFDYDNNQWASYNVRVLPAYWNGSASWGNTHEPDNTKYLARLIQTDGTLYHYANLNKADRDWVRFTAKEGVVYTIALSNEAGGNYYFRVYDAAYTNFSGDKNTSWVWTCPVTGTYFIQVWESGDDRVGSFDISISAGDAENTVDIQPTQVSLYSDPGYGVDSYQLTANSSNCSDQIQWDSSNSLVVSVNDNGEIQAVAPGSTVVSATCTADGTNDFVRVTVNADDYEPNNVQAQARYIAVGQGYQSHIVRPNGSNPDRNDWIKFDAVEGYGYVIELAHELGGNVYYKLYDEVGTILLSNIDALATWICPKTGTYYLRAFDYDHNQWSSFKIRVLPAYWNGNAAWDERYEPNDKWYAAYQIRTDGTVYHHENGTAIGDSVDWLRFTATEGQSYSFLLANELGGDFYFIVRNSSFTSLSGGRSSNWTWTCPKTETYFIGIYENGYDRIGSYDFSINSDPIDYSVDIPMDNVALYLDAEYGVTSYQLIANSSNGSDSIAWSSSDASIVAVDSNGMIQAIGAGLAVVTATCTIDGSFDQVAVTVSEVKDPDCSLYLDPLYGPISCQLASTCSGQIVWSSTDDTIASVDANGLVQSTGTGAVTITADCVEDGTDEEFFISVQTDNYENDDDQSQAGLIVVGNEYQSHLLTPNTDNPDVFDWLKFDAIEGYGYVIELAEVSGGAVRCQLYNEEGIPVSAAINTQAEWKCPVSGTYYVKVWESGNNQSASYKIRVLPAYWNGTGVWDSNYEPDNNHYNAFLVETDGTLYHHENINPKDYDAIRFSALEGQTYTISLSDEVGGNYFFSLYDSRFRDILGNQSTSVSWICPVTGTYYVLIWENGTDRSGVYDFSITADVTDYTVDIPNDRVTLYLESSWGVSSYQLAANSSNCSDQIQWSSSDIAVVSVDANGLLQAQGAGRSVISATCSIDGSSDELTVTVNADDYESNDFQVLAKPVLVGQNYQSHQLRPNAAVPDVYDWVKFDAVEGYGYVIEVANETAGDVRFNMFNENGNSLLNGVSSRSEWTCPVSGKYFLQIYENNNDHWTSYQLRVLPSYWNGTAEWGADHEPDEGLYIAEQIKTDGTVYHYANSNPADVDWVRFLAREGNTYTFLPHFCRPTS